MQILLYVLDASSSEERDPLQDLFHLQRELELYRPSMTARPSLIVANKMDQAGETIFRVLSCLITTPLNLIVAAGAEENLIRLREKANLTVLPIRSAH